MDPVILANILTALLATFISLPLVLVAGRIVWRARQRDMDRRRAPEPDDCGDQGGHPQPVEPRHARPKAHETGSWRPAGVGIDDIFKPWKAGD